MLVGARRHAKYGILALTVAFAQLPAMAQVRSAPPTPIGQLSIGDGPAVPIYSFSFGASNPTVVGTPGGGAGAGKVNMSDMSVMKQADALSAPLLRYVTMGVHLQRARIEIFPKTAGGLPATFDLTDVVVTAYQVSGGDVVESVSLSFDRMAMTSGGASFCWDNSAYLAC
jgi:hypothetical protein